MRSNLAGAESAARAFALSRRDGETLLVREFVQAIKANQATFGVQLSDDTIDRLADYYKLVQQHNEILHLVAPCPPEEFATRHILESLTLVEHLPNGARFADVGTGAGLPSIPCLIARDDLHAVLIDSKEKKAVFLRSAIEVCALANRAEVIDRQFAETKTPDVRYVTCRALDRFTGNLPRLLKWSGRRKLLFFGGPSVRQALTDLGVKFDERLMPLSSQRYLFISK